MIYSIVLDNGTYYIHASTEIGVHIEYRYPTGFWFRESAERTVYDLEEGFMLFSVEEWIRL